MLSQTRLTSHANTSDAESEDTRLHGMFDADGKTETHLETFPFSSVFIHGGSG